MKEINVLTPEIYNRLAAGEVVENPASIVKELVENSIDANAQKITIDIINGGIDEIVVTDDGEGVNEANLPKVFLPHATSKIKTVSDVDSIATLGFRGEAMASIASVAKVEFTSKPREQSYAVSVNQDQEIRMAAGNNGTTVRVANLFYNTPARKKFLRSANTEKNNVTQVVENVIFSNPDLFVRYAVDGRTIIDHKGTGLLAAVKQIFAVPTTDMLPVDYGEAGISVKGYLSNTHLSKSNKDRQIVIINGRVVNGGLPAAVVNEVMSNYLPLKEFPVFVLQISIDVTKVDVNVHPQKKEVRFDDKEGITLFMKNAVKRTLDKFFMGEFTTIAKPIIVKPAEATVETKTESQAPQHNIVGNSFEPNNTQAKTILLKSLDLLGNAESVVKSAPNILNAIEVTPKVEIEEQVSVLKQNEFTVLGQIFETYLLVKTPEALLVIDQHAMAERINYDKFRKEIDTDSVKSQGLLTPMIIKLSSKELSKFEELRPLLLKFGFDCDQFGEGAIRVAAIPAVMSNSSVKEFLSILLEDKEIVGGSLSDVIKHRVATMACKASIKAGDILSETQIEYFMNNYFANKNIPLCPHGRPIMMVYTKSKLENLFARK